MCQLYQERRDTLISGLNSSGLHINAPKATFYAWLNIPKKTNTSTSLSVGGERSRTANSMKFSALLLEKANIVVTPGVGFGKYGEGYIRMALTVSVERIQEAVERLKRIL